ncbi:hypothetical protein HDU88_000181 [Geranomyces variabilis]|nr:hypothetical protein HDU88_000181 [Geranomyces variabilis]
MSSRGYGGGSYGGGGGGRRGAITTAGQTAHPGIVTSTTHANANGAGLAASHIGVGLTVGMSAREAVFTMTSGRGRERDHLRPLQEGGRGRLGIARGEEIARAAETITTAGVEKATTMNLACLVVGETAASVIDGVIEIDTSPSAVEVAAGTAARTDEGDRDRAASAAEDAAGAGAKARRGGSPIMVDDHNPNDGGEQQEELDEEEQMKRLMGFAGFDSTQGKKVVGSDASGVAINKQRTYRQYMNRRRGFNRNLSPTK